MLGPNGAGKTTLMLHLNGLLAGEGALDVAGIRDVRELRAAVGLVFQDPDDQLFMPTVGEDVAFGLLNLGLTRDEVTARAGRAGGRADEPRGGPGAASALARSSGSGSRSRPCSPCGRGCWCSTSRRPTSTRAPGASCSRCWTCSPAHADARRHPRPAVRRAAVRAP